MSARTTTSSIGRKILLRTIAVGLLPLGVLALVVLIGVNGLKNTAADRVDESRERLSQESVVVTAEDQANSIRREINTNLKERISDAIALARAPEVVDAAKEGANVARDQGLAGQPIEDLEAEFEATKTLTAATGATNYLANELAFHPDFREIFFTDVNGFNVAYTSPTSDFVQSDEDWWQEAWETGLSVSDVEFDESAGVFSVDISVRVDDQLTGRQLGVMKTVLSIAFVQDIATDRSLDNIDYTIALDDGRLIAETATDNDPARMMNTSVSGGAVSDGLFVAQNAVNGRNSGGALVTDETVYGYVRTTSPETFEDISKGDFAGFDWIVLSSQPSAAAFAPLQALEALNDDIDQSGDDLRTLVIIVALIGLGIALLMARLMSQGITRPIRTLTDAAAEAAQTGLPEAVAAVNAEGGNLDTVDIPEVHIDTNDELEELAQSFNLAQGTAIRLAAEQAQGRKNTQEMFVNLGRRNQSLLKRQLRYIDGLEQSESNPDTLDSLFKLDHLATRMRRNAESLLVLAGDRSPRRWAAPIEIRDAVQAALAEVENYERVEMAGIADGEVQGNVVADVAHILAEIIENALNFSPPQAAVTVSGRKNQVGYTLTVTDEGLGMSPEEMEAANERLISVSEFTQVPTQYLGLFVVGRLAQRHDIGVSLAAAPSGGLAVTIELPGALTDPAPEAEETPEESAPADSTSMRQAMAIDGIESDDPEIASAQAEVFELLAKAEEALAKIEAAKQKAKAAEEAKTVEADRAAQAAKAAKAAEAVQAAKLANASSTAATRPAPPIADAPGNTAEQNRRADDRNQGASESVDTVEVGGIAVPRRQPAGRPTTDETNQQRRATDPADSTSEDAAAEFGFKRREAKQSAAQPETTPAAAAAKSAPLNEDEALATAQQTRNQWSRFAKGKAEAEAAPDV